MIELTATQAAAEIARGVISAEEYTRACLDRIAAVESEVQAFAHLDPEHALDAGARARRVTRPKAGASARCTAFRSASRTSSIPRTIRPNAARRSSPAAGPGQMLPPSRKLREAGAVIIGKTVTTEFAYFHPGKTRNPRDLKRTPGGSSSGSAAAVAAGMVPLAIGSQTNGSMIRPAAFCGVFGVKPSHGLISRAGALTLSRKLDHVGAFARSIEDLALILDVLVGHDPADPDSRPYASPSFRVSAAEAPPIPPSFALVRTPMWEKADADARSALEDLAKELGAREVDLPEHYRDAWSGLRAIMAVDMAHNLGAFVDKGGKVSKPFGELITEGRKVTATEYLAAVRDARRYADGMAGIFEQIADAIITLSAKGVAPLGIGATGDPVFCTLWTLIGFPSLNVPLLANADGLPIGVQLVGAHGRDERLLRTARALVEHLAEVE